MTIASLPGHGSSTPSLPGRQLQTARSLAGLQLPRPHPSPHPVPGPLLHYRTRYGRSVPTQVDYEHHGRGYARRRRADPRIAARIHAALGDARTVLNVGAGPGPTSRATAGCWRSSRARRCAPSGPPRRRRRSRRRRSRCRFDDDAVDAAMACVTIHHWSRPRRRPRRAAPRRPRPGRRLHLRTRRAARVAARLLRRGDWGSSCRASAPSMRSPPSSAARTRVETIPTPADCIDGFFEAYWNRPEALLDPEVRAAQSIWAADRARDRGADRRRASPAASSPARGTPSTAPCASRESYEGSLRLVISEPA